MKIASNLSRERIELESRRDYWPQTLLTEYLDKWAARYPERIAVTDVNTMTGIETVVTYRDLHRYVQTIARKLIGFGVKHQDIVSFQLPNCWQFVALHLACVRIGAVTNPLMPIFRQRELAFMLNLAESRVVIIPKSFRGFDYPAMYRDMRPRLPQLQHCLVIGGEEDDSFFECLPGLDNLNNEQADDTWLPDPMSPDDIIHLIYTSGTTGEPKGVLHTSNTLIGNASRFCERFSLGADDVLFMPSPMAHSAGFIYGMMVAVFLGAPLVLLDIWDPQKAARLMEKWRVSYAFAPTPFLSDLTYFPDLANYDLSSFRLFLSAGAPIPPALVTQATSNLSARIVRAWGMTELGLASASTMDDPMEKIMHTDGIAISGIELRVVDNEGEIAAVDAPGNLQSRGAANFIGYLKRPQLYATDADGWFDTGDLASMDVDGYIRITGRVKDIIIRGGENIPVVEVEELIYSHEAVREVAIVAMPDARLGERCCAFVALHPGQKLLIQELLDFLEQNKLARHYFPEHVEIIDEMPHTPAGKTQKFRLRELAAEIAKRSARQMA